MTCQTPTAKYPDGRTATDAGYQAHKKAGEQPCGPCHAAHIDKGQAYWEGLSAEQREMRRQLNRAEAERYRTSNPEGAHAAKVLFMATSREMIRQAKSMPCADCKVQYPYWVMQFDHLGDKEFNIGQMGPTASRERVLAEIAKCDVVCANCHAERTHQRRMARVTSESISA